MRVSADYRDYVLEQLACLGPVTGKSMFGGVGIYLDGVFFALIANDALYFKVGDANRVEYQAAGMGPFQPYSHRKMTMSYYEVPVEVLEDTDQLRVWGRKAVEAAGRASSKQAAVRRTGHPRRVRPKPRKAGGR